MSPQVSTSQRNAAGTSDRSLVQSLQRAVAVLDHLVHSDRPLSALELSRDTEIERTTVHRILRTLESEQLVASVNGRYAMGPRALLYGNAYLDRLAIRRASLPFEVEVLTSIIGSSPWAVQTWVPINAELALVNQLFGKGALLGNLLTLGSRYPIEETAAGRCILAHLPKPTVAELIGAEKAKALRSRLKKVLVEGIDHEVKLGITAIAAPILDSSGQPVGGMSLSGPGVDEHIDPDSPVATAVRRTALGISQAL